MYMMYVCMCMIKWYGYETTYVITMFASSSNRIHEYAGPLVSFVRVCMRMCCHGYRRSGYIVHYIPTSLLAVCVKAKLQLSVHNNHITSL